MPTEQNEDQLLHWIEQLEAHAKYAREQFEEGNYGNILRMFRTTASMMINNALVTAAIVAEDHDQYVPD